MRRFLLQRLIALIPTMIGISILVFFVIRQIPGDAITAKLGAEAAGSLSQEQEASYRAYFGLDKSLPQQYLEWIGGIVRGNFGASEIRHEPVLNAISETYPLTLELTLLALLIALTIGLPLGILSATLANNGSGGALDLFVRTFSLIGLSIPSFWLGTLIILLLSTVFHVMPDAGDYVPPTQDLLRNLSQLIFPAFSLGFGFSASIMRTTRAEMLEVLSQDYIRTARSKGLRQRGIIWPHALRNSLIPIVTLVGIEMGYLLGGAVLVETVFALPGLGQMIYTAIVQRDYALVQGGILFAAANFLIINLAVDVIYSVIDPRVAHG